MRHHRFRVPFLVTMGILAVGLIGLSGCSSTTFVAQTYQAPILPPIIEVTVDQLYAEYMADEAAADAKYKGKRLMFAEVAVEGVHGHFSTGQDFLDNLMTDRETAFDYFVMIGSVRFEPRNPQYIYGIQVGDVIDIVGYIQGMSEDGTILIKDCWIKIISGGEGGGGY